MQKLPFRLALCTGLAIAFAALIDAGCDESTNPTLSSATEAGSDGPKVPVEASTIDTFVPVPPDEPRPDGCAPPVPNPVQDFTPTWKAPAALHQAKCTDVEIDEIVRCNFDPNADAGTCDAVLKDAGSRDCNNCLFTASTANHLGPVVISGNIGTLNIAGCIAALEGDVTKTGCGARFAASEECARESCFLNSTCADFATLADCLVAAKSTVCAQFSAAAACADPLLAPGGIAEACNDGPDQVTAIIRLGHLFCGAGDADAALDGATDG